MVYSTEFIGLEFPFRFLSRKFWSFSYFTEGPSLPPNEIISSHKLGIIAAEIRCYSLCQEESRCVGFNYRTTATNDENCQLTNVTRKRNTTKKGDWTLRRDVEAVCFLFLVFLDFDSVPKCCFGIGTAITRDIPIFANCNWCCFEA